MTHTHTRIPLQTHSVGAGGNLDILLASLPLRRSITYRLPARVLLFFIVFILSLHLVLHEREREICIRMGDDKRTYVILKPFSRKETY